MLRVPKRGWMPPSTKSSPSRAPSRWAVPRSPSGPAAYETWSRRIRSILTTSRARRHTGVDGRLAATALVLVAAGVKSGAPADDVEEACRGRQSTVGSPLERGGAGGRAGRRDPQRGPGRTGGFGKDDTGRDPPGLGRCAEQGRDDR